MDLLLSLTDPWAYVLVALLTAGEASAFIGLFVPGETAMLVGGFLVYSGRASLGWMLAAGALGAIVGDSIGYEIGRHLGPRLQRGRLGRIVGRERWERAEDYVRTKGGRAVFFGRWVGVLRALVPAIVGSAGYPYPKFLAFNIAGGVLWATAFVLLGVGAGSSWRVVEHWVGRGMLVLVGFLVVAGLTALGARWLTKHPERVRAWWERALEIRFVAWVWKLARPQIEFLRRRLQPGRRFGLYLTVGLVLTVAGSVAFGVLLADVVAHRELALVDRPILDFFQGHRTSGLSVVARSLSSAGVPAAAIGALGVASGVAYAVSRDVRWPVFLVASAAGALVLDDIVKLIVHRPAPNGAASSFPSAHATSAAATLAALAFLIARGRSWKLSVWTWTSATFLAMLVAMSRVYIGREWFTDALAGFVLGGAWTAVAAVATSLSLGGPPPPPQRERR